MARKTEDEYYVRPAFRTHEAPKRCTRCRYYCRSSKTCDYILITGHAKIKIPGPHNGHEGGPHCGLFEPGKHPKSHALDADIYVIQAD